MPAPAAADAPLLPAFDAPPGTEAAPAMAGAPPEPGPPAELELVGLELLHERNAKHERHALALTASRCRCFD